MGIKINIDTADSTEENNIDIKITPDDGGVNLDVIKEETLDYNLNLRSALNGDLMIMDHKDIDIVIQQGNKKIVAFAKDAMTDAVYGAESRLLEFLRKKGVIKIDSIQGGNVYGSLEGTIMESDDFHPISSALINVSEWMETERPYMQGVTAYDDMQDDALTDPDNIDSTDLGDVSQAEEKGSISPRTIFSPAMYGRFSL
jgi:hypothetical protein